MSNIKLSLKQKNLDRVQTELGKQQQQHKVQDISEVRTFKTQCSTRM
jgi:hypothetical protein